MPLGQGSVLSDQQAVDVVLYIDAQSRVSFNLKDHLLPAATAEHNNSRVLSEKHSVKSNFEDFCLDIDTIRGDHIIE